MKKRLIFLVLALILAFSTYAYADVEDTETNVDEIIIEIDLSKGNQTGVIDFPQTRGVNDLYNVGSSWEFYQDGYNENRYWLGYNVNSSGALIQRYYCNLSIEHPSWLVDDVYYSIEVNDLIPLRTSWSDGWHEYIDIPDNVDTVLLKISDPYVVFSNNRRVYGLPINRNYPAH